jgi:hypothetical protein
MSTPSAITTKIDDFVKKNDLLVTNDNYYPALLVIASLCTISTSSGVLAYYNGPPTTAPDNYFYLHVVFLTLASLGFIVGLFTLTYPNYEGAFSWLFSRAYGAMISVVWLGVAVTSTILAQTKIKTGNGATVGFVAAYLLEAIVLFFMVWGFFYTPESSFALV